MNDIRKYPRTPHVVGSRRGCGDDLIDVPWEELAGKHLVIEEKVDGANCGISFGPAGQLLLQSRGHYLRGGPREKQFELLKQWAATHQSYLLGVLGTRHVMYGEWLFAKHTVFYDVLPHYFMEFDIFDTDRNVFLDTRARTQLLTGRSHRRLTPSSLEPVIAVPVLFEGRLLKFSELTSLVSRSLYVSNDRREHLKLAAMSAGQDINDVFEHTDLDDRAEGLYIKWEEDGIVRERYKYVRSSFTNSILDQETYWHDRPIVQNGLQPGALEQMFT